MDELKHSLSFLKTYVASIDVGTENDTALLDMRLGQAASMIYDIRHQIDNIWLAMRRQVASTTRRIPTLEDLL